MAVYHSKKRGRPKGSKNKPHNVFREYLEAHVTKTSLTLVEEMDNLTKEVYRNLENPAKLGLLLMELSAKNQGLGNYFVEARDEERTLDTQYKWTVDKRKLELIDQEGLSATVAESKAKVEANAMLEQLNLAKKNVDILSIKRGDVDRLTSIGQTVLRDIGQNMVRP